MLNSAWLKAASPNTDLPLLRIDDTILIGNGNSDSSNGCDGSGSNHSNGGNIRSNSSSSNSRAWAAGRLLPSLRDCWA